VVVHKTTKIELIY